MYSKIFIPILITLLQIKILVAEPSLKLPNGQIVGRESVTLENKSFYAFEGIPYAAPPVGDLRFQPPQPVKDWDGVLNTTNLEATCYMVSRNDDGETEDCLYLNVFTPELPSEENSVSLPVMLYIHGGGFIAGSSVNTAPDLFINNDVILVSINYRLGIFGFISTQDEVIPGNNGLKDQQFAIKWTHDNIHLFGGNPEKITIFGQSAGSASCAYQILYQNSNGLFQGAILESGSFLSPWTYQRKAREIAFTTASYLNSSFETSDDSQALLEFLLTVDAEKLDKAAEQYRNLRNTPEDLEISQGFYFAPVIEVKNPDAFLTKKMYGLVQAGSIITVPTLIGVTSEENLVFNTDADVLKETMAAYDEHLDWVVPYDMGITDEDGRTEMGRLIRELYTGGEPWADHIGDGVRYSSDTSFTRSVIKHAELASKVAEIYFYLFSYDGELGGLDTHYDGAENVGHGEELRYIFCSGFGCDVSNRPESDQIMQKRLIKVWTDFAKYQNPTPEPSELLQNLTWPLVAVDDGDFYYVDINEDWEIKNHPKEENYQRWNELYDSLGYTDFDTY